MIRIACGMAVAMFLLAGTSTGWSQQQYLYSPEAVGAEVKTPGKDGILVREVPVQKGDTLFGISRKFSGHGSYYPQILLFNKILDPNKIYPGDVFRIPVSRDHQAGPVQKRVEHGGHTAVSHKTAVTPLHKQVPAAQPAEAVTEISIHDLKKAETVKDKKRESKDKAGTAKKQATAAKQHATATGASDSASGPKLFERAVKAYRQDDYRTALELFDRYLEENRTSPLAADASLYKAECYLKLSSQN